MTPQRIQRKRTKGWRMPPNTVYVGPPTRWGNPWRHEDVYMPAYVPPISDEDVMLVILYKSSLEEGHLVFSREDVRRELQGKNLACWCPLDQPCHADVLLKIANTRGGNSI